VTQYPGELWRARIRGDDGAVHGGGLLLTARSVLTCDHVLAAGSGGGPAGAAPPPSVTVDFPIASRRRVIPATVRGGRTAAGPPGRSTLAVLDLAAPQHDLPVATLGRHREGRSVRMYGHPRGQERGVWASATVGGTGGPGGEWVGLDNLAVQGPGTDGGFGGVGVFDPADATVVGIVVATGDRSADAEVAWMLPAEAMTRHLVAAGVSGFGGFGAGSPRTEIFTLVELLLDVQVMADREGRNRVVEMLRPDIMTAVPRHPQGRADVYSIVRTCLNYAGGLAELVDVISAFEPGSLATQRLLSAVAARL
jgi:Effector-associated domain 2/Trypsin-like peptidase domain